MNRLPYTHPGYFVGDIIVGHNVQDELVMGKVICGEFDKQRKVWAYWIAGAMTGPCYVLESDIYEGRHF